MFSSCLALVGPTFLCIIGDQFARLKKSDRFFYDVGGTKHSFTNCKSNKYCLYIKLKYKLYHLLVYLYIISFCYLYVISAQLQAIRQVSMSRIICDNTDEIRSIQPLAFHLPNNGL